MADNEVEAVCGQVNRMLTEARDEAARWKRRALRAEETAERRKQLLRECRGRLRPTAEDVDDFDFRPYVPNFCGGLQMVERPRRTRFEMLVEAVELEVEGSNER